MRIAGLIGGIGPESTLEYYRLIVSAYGERKGDGSHPLLVINSIELNQVVDTITRNALDETVDYLVTEIERLARAGADFGALAANTPHIVFDEIQRRSPIPLISIVEATRDAAAGMKRVALLGTRFTMQGRFYADVFARSGIELIVPPQSDHDWIHDKYMNELVNGKFFPETRERLLGVVDDLIDRHHVEAVILGGTELPLLLRDHSRRGVPLLDTTKIHVDRIVDELLR